MNPLIYKLLDYVPRLQEVTSEESEMVSILLRLHPTSCVLRRNFSLAKLEEKYLQIEDTDSEDVRCRKIQNVEVVAREAPGILAELAMKRVAVSRHRENVADDIIVSRLLLIVSSAGMPDLVDPATGDLRDDVVTNQQAHLFSCSLRMLNHRFRAC